MYYFYWHLFCKPSNNACPSWWGISDHLIYKWLIEFESFVIYERQWRDFKNFSCKNSKILLFPQSLTTLSLSLSAPQRIGLSRLMSSLAMHPVNTWLKHMYENFQLSFWKNKIILDTICWKLLPSNARVVVTPLMKSKWSEYEPIKIWNNNWTKYDPIKIRNSN